MGLIMRATADLDSSTAKKHSMRQADTISLLRTSSAAAGKAVQPAGINPAVAAVNAGQCGVQVWRLIRA